MIKIENIDPNQAEQLCRKITTTLPAYFGLPVANEHYAIGVRNCSNIAIKKGNDYLGLISLNFPYDSNANIYWMAVLPDFHRKGMGKMLIEAACDFAKSQGAKTLTVETLSPSETEENYLNTYQFYQAQSFAPFFDLKPDGYTWNMVYMLKLLESRHE